MHDTGFEDRLRGALRSEADALPFSITLDDLDARLAQRRRSGGGRRPLLTAAAALAVLIGGASVIALSGRSTTPPVGASPSANRSPSASTTPSSASAAGLPSFGEMRSSVVTPNAVVTLTTERAADPSPVPDRLETYEVGTVPGNAATYTVAFACTDGPFSVVWSDAADPTARALHVLDQPRCEARPSLFTSPRLPELARLQVRTSPGVAWRLLVVGTDGETGLEDPPHLTDPIEPSAGWTAVAGMGGTSNGAGDTERSDVHLFTVPADVSVLLLSAMCRGDGSLVVDVTGGAEMEVPCPTAGRDPKRSFVRATGAAEVELRVEVTGAVDYHVLIEGSDGPLASTRP